MTTPPRDVIASYRYLRVAPKKVRLILDLIRGKHVQAAEQQLLHLPRAASTPLLKLLRSAQANAQHNFKLDPKSLVVRRAFADEGPKLKRYRPRAMGRAGLILKRMSHVTVVLTPLAAATPAPAAVKEPPPTKLPIKAVKGGPAAPQGRMAKPRPSTTTPPHRRLSHPGEKSNAASKAKEAER